MAFKESPNAGRAGGGNLKKYGMYFAALVVVLGVVGFFVQRCAGG